MVGLENLVRKVFFVHAFSTCDHCKLDLDKKQVSYFQESNRCPYSYCTNRLMERHVNTATQDKVLPDNPSIE